jgi:hypothetical protein
MEGSWKGTLYRSGLTIRSINSRSVLHKSIPVLSIYLMRTGRVMITAPMEIDLDTGDYYRAICRSGLL